MPDRLLDVSRLHMECRYIYVGHCQMSGTYFRACELEIWRIFSDKFLVWNLLGLTYIMFPIVSQQETSHLQGVFLDYR